MSGVHVARVGDELLLTVAPDDGLDEVVVSLPIPEGVDEFLAAIRAEVGAGWRPSALDVETFCWLFTVLGHGGDTEDPATWSIHLPTARRAVELLADRMPESAAPDREAVVTAICGALPYPDGYAKSGYYREVAENIADALLAGPLAARPGDVGGGTSG